MTATKTKPAKTAGSRKKEGLRKGQFAVLAVLYKLSPQAGMTRNKIAEKALNGHMGWAFNHIGSADPKQRVKHEKWTGFPSLLTLKAVSTAVVQSDEGGPKERIFRITATGKQLHDKYVRDEAAKVAAKKEAEKAKAARLKERERKAAAKAKGK